MRFDSNRKANFERVKKMCAKASYFIEEPAGKKSMFLVVFEKTAEQVRLASAITSELHSASWKYTLFANGRVQRNKHALLNTLDCMAVASRCKDHRAHCHQILEDPFEETERPIGLTFSIFNVSEESDEPKEFWTLPCKMLDGFVKFDRRLKANPAAQLDAAAVARNVNLCPFFAPSEFKLAKLVYPKKRKGKAYW